MLERQHLAIVRELARQGSLTAAAQQLCLSQSALSHSIRKLETQVGTALWHREGRRLLPTQAGRYLLEVANRLLPQLEHAELSLQHFAEGTRGILRIGMECHPCYQWLLKVAADYIPRWPDVDMDVRQKFRFGGIDALVEHDIDLLVTPDPEQRPGLVYEPVFDYEQVLVVNTRHPLAVRKWVRPEELQTETLLTYPVDTERLDIFTRFLDPAGIRPRQHKRLESTDLMLQLVDAGRGVAALPRWLVEEKASSMAIVPVRLGSRGVPKQIYLGTRSSDQALDYLQGFIALARERKV